MVKTIEYILNHPDEFDKNWKVIIIDRDIDLNSDSYLKNEERINKKKIKRYRTQFTIYGKPNINSHDVYEKIPTYLYDKLKEITKLTSEGVSIDYWNNEMWFVTSSQDTLDKVNKVFGTSFKFHNKGLDGVIKDCIKY